LLQWFDVLYPQKDKVHWTMKVASLWEKNSWWAKISKNWFKKKMKLAPWMEEGIQNFLTQIGSCGVVWIPSTTNVFPFLGGNNQSGYCVL
jgi:transposase-like protein